MSVTSNKHLSDMPSIIIESGSTAVGTDVDIMTTGTGRLYSMKLDNSTGGGSVCYFKVYDAKSVTLGTTEPNFIFRCTSATIHTVSSKQGLKIDTGLTVALSDEGGKSSSTGFASFKYTLFGD